MYGFAISQNEILIFVLQGVILYSSPARVVSPLVRFQSESSVESGNAETRDLNIYGRF